MTAVEMLAESLRLRHKEAYNDMYEDIEVYYKKIEREQIEEAFYCGNQIHGNWDSDSSIYYNETYKKD